MAASSSMTSRKSTPPSIWLKCVPVTSVRLLAVSTENMKAGRTYEMLYTAVDYNGVTSTAHFYFTVVE